VAGLSAFHHNRTDYLEYSVGLENILKNLRIDYYWGRKDGEKFENNFRIGFSRKFSIGRRNDD
jgi:hypothetical protein